MPSEENIHRIVELANPNPDYRQQCRNSVIGALWSIKNFNVTLPAAAKKRLERVADKLRKARIAVDQLPYVTRRSLNITDEFRSDLGRIEQESESQARRMRPRSSGGLIVDGMRMLFAAERAFDLLNDYGGGPPRLTRGGRYFNLTDLLFRVATGRRIARSDDERGSDAERACIEFFKRLEQDGFPNAEQRRRMQRDPYYQRDPNRD
jgi:hypothetical protein